MNRAAIEQHVRRWVIAGLLGSALAAAGTGAMLADAAEAQHTPQTVLDERSLVPVGVFMAGALVVAGVIWRASAFVTQRDERERQMREEIDELCKRVTNLETYQED